MITGDGTDRAGLLGLFRFSRKKARAAYQEVYGVAVDDPAIDKELELHLYRDGRESDIVQLPTKIAMALVFRGSSQSGGRPPKEKYAKHQEALLVEWASKRMNELIAGGMKEINARPQAAREAIASGAYKWAGIKRVSVLSNKMRRNLSELNPDTGSST